MTPDDRALAERYPELPSLAVLLDPEALEQVSAAWGRGYAIERLRLKPGASVTAVLRPPAHDGAGPSLPWLLARGLAPQLWATKRNKDVRAAEKSWRSLVKAAEANTGSCAGEHAITGPRGPAVVADDEHRVLVTPAIGDRQLEGLRRLLPDTGIPVRLERLAGDGPFAAMPDEVGDLRRRGTVRTLSHNPARRFVGHWSPERGDGPGYNVRLHAGRRREITPFVPGRPWRLGDDVPAIEEMAAERARVAAESGRPWGRPDIAGALRAAAAGIAAIDVAGRDWAARGARLASELTARLAHVGVAAAHGDLSGDQLVITSGAREGCSATPSFCVPWDWRHRVTCRTGGSHGTPNQSRKSPLGTEADVAVLDWDRAGLWPTGWDAATWAVTSALTAATDGTGATDGPAQGTSAVEPCGDVLAAVALLRAPEPFRRRYAGWAGLTEELVTLAERSVGRVGCGPVALTPGGVR